MKQFIWLGILAIGFGCDNTTDSATSGEATDLLAEGSMSEVAAVDSMDESTPGELDGEDEAVEPSVSDTESEPISEEPESEEPLPREEPAPVEESENVEEEEPVARGPVSITETLESITVAGLARQYRLWAPDGNPEGGYPILIAFHGGGGQFEAFPQENQFRTLAEQEGIIVAFPRGYVLGNNEGEWQLNTPPNKMHDIEFVEAIIDGVADQYPVDLKRVYATGYSLGSMFTYELMCHLSDRFAGIASHAGTMPINPNSCEMDRNVALMHIHGADDWLISYTNSWGWKAWDEVGDMHSVPSLVAFWAEKQGCGAVEIFDSASSEHQVYPDCGDVRVEHHKVKNVGHEWPMSINGVSTHQVIWDFVSEFSNP